MEDQLSFLSAPRWTILLDKKSADEWEDIEFNLIEKHTNIFSDDYVIFLIDSVTMDGEYTAEDILASTGALAVHEEFSNAVVSTPEAIEELNDEVYSWNGSGSCFLADMLTDVEKLQFLLTSIYEEKKHIIPTDEIKVVMSKGEPAVSLKDNIEKLFTEDPYQIEYADETITLWWPTIIENRGLFLVILTDEDEEDEEEIKKLPAPKYPYANPYDDYDDYGWGSYYDDYDYDDRYYRRT